VGCGLWAIDTFGSLLEDFGSVRIWLGEMQLDGSVGYLVELVSLVGLVDVR
jgi:hypothetical protein